MAELLATYDPGAVIVTLGNHVASAFAEGSMVMFEKDTDYVTPKVGGTGTTTYSFSRNNNHTVTIRLQQHSPTVQFIENLKSVNGIVRIPPVLPIVVRDPSSYDQIRGGYGILMTDATHNFDAEAGEREYVFHLVNAAVGSNDAIAATNLLANAGIIP